MSTIRCVDGDYLFAYNEIYPLKQPQTHEGRRYTHGRGLYPVYDPTSVRIELLPDDTGRLLCDHGSEKIHPVPRNEHEWDWCEGPPWSAFMICLTLNLSRKLVLPRYDPLKDTSTYEGALVMLAETLHESRKRNR